MVTYPSADSQTKYGALAWGRQTYTCACRDSLARRNTAGIMRLGLMLLNRAEDKLPISTVAH